MHYVYMFTGDERPGRDFAWVSNAEFRRRFHLASALGFLRTIQNRIRGERGRRATDFYVGLRHTFAELDGLGKLLAGEEGVRDTGRNAVVYGEEYLGRVNPLYRDLYGLLFGLHRNSLMHTGLIRTVRLRPLSGKPRFLKWALRGDRTRHLELERLRPGSVHLWISVPQFRDDAAASVDHYIADLTARGESSLLFRRLRRGYFGTGVWVPVTLTTPFPEILASLEV